MENLCSSFFSFTSLAGVGGGVIMVTLSCPCPSPRHPNIFCGSPLSVLLTLRDSLINLKAIFELFSRRQSLLYFFSEAFNITLVNLFILAWHSNYELSNKTQKPFFILEESSKCHNINYRAKNHVVMFCFGLKSIARFINTNTSYFNTHRLESEGKFSWNFLISVPSVWVPPSAVPRTRRHSAFTTDLPTGE